MRILTFLNYRPERGGITDQVALLAEDLRPHGVELEFVDTHGSLSARLKSLVVGLRQGRNADLILGVGCAFFGFFPIFVAAIVGFVLNKPLLYNFHDGQAAIFLRKYGRWVKLIIGRSPVVVASEFVEEAFREYGFQTRLIPNHFDFDRTLPARKKAFRWNQKILWARSFCSLYQPGIALEAARRVVAENDACEFHFFGEGELLEDLKARYQHPRIVFRGFVARPQFLKEYENYSVFLNTTAYDNFPLSIVEAGHYGLLVVSSRVGGIASVYDEAEILYYNNNKPAELAELLLQVLQQPERFDSFRAQLQKRTRFFTWQNVRKQWLDTIYGSLPARNSGKQVCAEFVVS